MKINKKQVGHRIKSIRQEKGMTLQEFGNLFNASRGNVSVWENGSSIPSNERLTQIAKIGNITVDELLYGSPREFLDSLIWKSGIDFNQDIFNEFYSQFEKTFINKNDIYTISEEEAVQRYQKFEKETKEENKLDVIIPFGAMLYRAQNDPKKASGYVTLASEYYETLSGFTYEEANRRYEENRENKKRKDNN